MKNSMLLFGILCFIAAAVMYMIGNSSSHLSELKDFFWVPLPLGVICVLVFFAKSKK